jgi:DNA-binding response OmpR family regulator
MSRVLVIEDSPDIRLLVTQMLQSEGYDVAVAEDGLEGLQLDATISADLVVLDVNLPTIDGYEVCRRLKERRNVPVLMLTVRAEEAEVNKGMQAGADLHISKPFDMATFLNCVRTLLLRSSVSFQA